MSRRLWVVLWGLALVLGLQTNSAELVEIRFIGTAEGFMEEPSGPKAWIVRVERVISGPQPCKAKLDVITWNYPPLPEVWGYADPQIEPQARVQVYGRYGTNIVDGCRVTLQGSPSYFMRLPVELVFAEIEIQPSSPTTEDEIEATLTVSFTREFGNWCFAAAQLSLLKREDQMFSVTAGEVKPDTVCILIYAPTKVGKYTHTLGKLAAGSYRFDLYDFAKLFLSKPFTVVVGIPIERALDRNGDRRIDDSELLGAIPLWISQAPVPGSGGQRISDAKMIELLDLWIKGRPIE